MKNWKNIFIIIAISVIIFSCFYVFLLFQGKFFIANKLHEATGRKVSIGQLVIKPPLNIELKNLEIEGLAKISSIYLSPSIPNIFLGKIAFNKIRIINPKIILEKKLSAPQEPIVSETVAIPDNAAVAVAIPDNAAAKPDVSKKSDLRLIIKSLKIRQGELDIIDQSAGTQGIKLTVRDISFDLKNLYTFAVDTKTDFELRGRIPWNTGEPDGKIYMSGWVNSYKKDMLSTLKIENIDGIAFHPYYSNWVDLEKARIVKAKLSFSSTIKGENNDIAANCHLELADIVRKVRAPEESQEKAERITDAVLDMFKAMNQGKVVLDFTFHTKMDRPEFSFAYIKSAFEGKIMQGRANSGLRTQDVLLLPGKMLQSGIRSGSNLSKALVDGVLALGNGLKQFFEDGMNKEVPEN
ncbi:MAG: DUF748 domain-containing protein [Candidatus Omnitrophica bacterium]|nr:DUF748 domain-containing protein [Candidatus Omnitrophota bacterium]